MCAGTVLGTGGTTVNEADWPPDSHGASLEMACVVMADFSPSAFSPSLKACLLSEVFPDHPGPHCSTGNSTAVNVGMIYLVLSLHSVNYFPYFYSSLWPLQLDSGHHENGDHSSAFSDSRLPTLLCTEGCFAHATRPSQTLGLCGYCYPIFSHMASQKLMLGLHFPTLNLQR